MDSKIEQRFDSSILAPIIDLKIELSSLIGPFIFLF